MKNFKKLTALILGVIMVLAMSVSSFAASITLTAKEGHTYQIYQIFTGTVDADGKTLTELKYGKNGTGKEGDFLSATDLAALKAIQEQNLTDEHAIIAAYTPFANLTSDPYEVAQGTKQADLPAGYYLIRDKDDKVPTDKPNDDITLYMFQVLNSDLSISAKSGTVESEKKVQDINDSDSNGLTGLQDSADYEIGDEIPYTLTFKLPEDYARYEKYYVQFSDDMDKGLTLIADSVKIAYGSAAATTITFTEANSTKYTGGKLYTYTIPDLKTTASALKAGDTITITYKAYLNDDAKYGAAGNPNTYTVKFNNNPNNSGEGKPTGDTPEDTNIVFTYKAVFDKVDENGDALEGADFTLYKKVDGSWVDVTTLGKDKHPAKVGSSEDKSTTFEFKGLDDGDYKIEETYTPDGYNTIAPILFTITAEHDVLSDDPQLTSLLATGGLELTGDTATGTLTTSIENKSGAVLPSTGGIGTTIFYVAGAILVLGAAVILITRRRVNAQ